MASPVIRDNITVDFQALTLVQLRDEALRLAAVLDLAQRQRREIHRLIEQRRAYIVASQQVTNLTPAERDALRDVLAVA